MGTKKKTRMGLSVFNSLMRAAFANRGLKVLSNDTGGGVRVVSVDRPIIC